MTLIEIVNVTKKYGNNIVLDNIDLIIKKGTFNLFIGQNGSGKSTTIKLILGFLRLKKNDTGKIYVKTNKISYVPEKVMIPPYVTIKEFLIDLLNLRSDGIIEGINNIKEYVEYFDLNPNQSISSLSKGMRQKVGIIQAILNDNDLIILDEPSSGLDIESIDKLKNILKKLKEKGKTIIVSTHNMDYYKELYDKIYEFSDKKLKEIL